MPIHEPTFSDTTTDEWDSPTLEDFGEEADLETVADHFLGSRTEFPPDDFGDLALPVVDTEGNLNLNALRNAKSRINQVEGFTEDEISQATAIIDRLANDNFKEADFGEEEGDSENQDRSLRVKVREMQETAGGVEYRSFETEMRVEESGAITGLAAPYGETADIGGMFQERYVPGAFKKTAQESDMRALYNHDANFVLGRVSAGTLETWEDDDGLHYRAEPPDTTWANDLRKTIKRGDVRESSIGMNVKRDDEDNDGVRLIKEAAVRDLGPVTFPAYQETTSATRSETVIQRASWKAGLDIEELARLLLRSERGKINRSRDREILERWKERLNRLEISDRVTYDDVERKKLELELEAEQI